MFSFLEQIKTADVGKTLLRQCTQKTGDEVKIAELIWFVLKPDQSVVLIYRQYVINWQSELYAQDQYQQYSR